jgi:hypothetical protein
MKESVYDMNVTFRHLEGMGDLRSIYAVDKEGNITACYFTHEEAFKAYLSEFFV